MAMLISVGLHECTNGPIVLVNHFGQNSKNQTSKSDSSSHLT